MKNKSQFAVEFVMLMAFMLLVFLGFFALISSRILDAKQTENQKIAENLANLVREEIILANSVTDGYNRVFNIPKKVKGVSYNISLLFDRELLVEYLGNEHLIFLPQNVRGNISVGSNEIKKLNGIIILKSLS